MQQIRPPGSGCHFAFYFLSDFSVIMSHYTNYANPGTLSKGGANVLKKSKVKVAAETAEEAALLVKGCDTLSKQMTQWYAPVSLRVTFRRLWRPERRNVLRRPAVPGNHQERFVTGCPGSFLMTVEIVSEFLSIRKRADGRESESAPLCPAAPRRNSRSCRRSIYLCMLLLPLYRSL